MIKKGFRYLRYRYLACFTALFMIGLAVSVYRAPVSFNFAAPFLGAAFVLFAAAALCAFSRREAAALCLTLCGAFLLGLGYPALRGVLVSALRRPAEALRLPYLGLMRAAEAVRSKITDFCESPCFSTDEGALLCGILIGSRGGFSDLLYETMSNSGFMHIAAVSGLHIGFLTAFISFCLRRAERKKRAAAAIPLLLFYMAVAAFTPSVSRAVIMCCVYLISQIAPRTPDSVTALSFSALLLCIISPDALKSVSFLMSYSATLALLLFMPPASAVLGRANGRLSALLSERLPRPQFFGKIIFSILTALTMSAATSLVSQIGIMPIALYYFHRISLMSFIGNIIVIPCTMAVFVCGLVCAAVYAVFPAAATLLGGVFVKPFLKIILSCAGFFSRFAYTPLHRPGPGAIVLFYILALLLLGCLVKAAEKLKSSAGDGL